MQRRTLRGWFEYLNDPDREITESEFMAVMLFNTREYSRKTLELMQDMKEATEHTEGMLGAIDEFVSYQAERAGVPYSGSSTMRAALDGQRDEQRQLAAKNRAQAIQGDSNHE